MTSDFALEAMRIAQKNCPVCGSLVNIYNVYTRQQEFRKVDGACITCLDRELAAVRGKNKKQEKENGFPTVRKEPKKTKRGK